MANNSNFYLLFALSILILVGCTSLYKKHNLDIKVNRKTSTISLTANNVLLSDILHRLREENSIRVVVPHINDKNIVIAAKDRPLIDALDVLIGQEYWVVVENGELFLTGSSGEKTPRILSEEPLPDSGETDHVTDEADKRHYAKLRFLIDAEKIQLESGLILSGEPVRHPKLINEYIYQVLLDGKVIETGSFSDPFVRHVYFPDENQPHGILKAESGRFSVLLPGYVLNEKQLNRIKIKLFKLVTSPPAKELSYETIDRFRDAFKESYVFDGKDIVGKLKRPNEKTK